MTFKRSKPLNTYNKKQNVAERLIKMVSAYTDTRGLQQERTIMRSQDSTLPDCCNIRYSISVRNGESEN